MKVVFAEILSTVRDTMYFIDHKSVYTTSLVELVKGANESGALHDLLRSQVDEFVGKIFNLAIDVAYRFVLLL